MRKTHSYRLSSPEEKLFFAGLYETHKGLLFLSVRQYISDSATAEDLVQDSLVKLMERADTVRGLSGGALAAYVAATARHTAVDYLRRTGAMPPPADDPDELADAGSLPEAALLRREELTRLRDVWPRLRQEDRLLLERKYLLGQTDEELARYLGCRRGSVRMKLTRARRAALRLMREGDEKNEESAI